MLLLRADGTADDLWGGRERPLACLDHVQRESAATLLADGDTLVLFTDGLVERRRDAIDDGLERLRTTALGLRRLAADDLCQQLVAATLADGPPDDDVCVLVVRHTRLLRPDPPRERGLVGRRGPVTLPRARAEQIGLGTA